MPEQANPGNPSNPAKLWILLTLTVPSEISEAVSALLFDLGTLGIVTLAETAAEVKLGAYFDAAVPIEERISLVRREMAGHGFSDRVLLSVDEVADQDWMEKWKEGFEATLVGQRLLITPSWKAQEFGPNGLQTGNGAPVQERGQGTPPKIVIQVDPGMAFGTGTHETTRLCLEALERYWNGGTLLDVGTGTGILAIAAALLHPGSCVTGIDIDPVAVSVARENVAINRVPPNQIVILEAQPKQFAGKGFDVVIANLTAEVIIDLAPDLIACLAPGGCLILSGILTELAADVTATLLRNGFSILEQRESGEWSSVVASLVLSFANTSTCSSRIPPGTGGRFKSSLERTLARKYGHTLQEYRRWEPAEVSSPAYKGDAFHPPFQRVVTAFLKAVTTR